jgi:hypothetical protein
LAKNATKIKKFGSTYKEKFELTYLQVIDCTKKGKNTYSILSFENLSSGGS